ncbi:MAG: RNA polymerase sigma factor [Phycisphaeraceae bacterium]|nr:MAG: RNA polymerase sigma factor [Phycisphaeraceae bacterium]
MSGPVRTATTTLLLDSLKDPANQDVWTEFDARYRPVLVGFARHLGLGPDDAADVAQQTLLEFVAQYRAGRYERGRGRLSSWIISIARFRVLDVMRTRGRRHEARGATVLGGIEDESLSEERANQAWEENRRRAIISLALTNLRERAKIEEKHVRAFELVALRGVPPEEAAAECGMTVDQVYVAKNRVTKRLREFVDEMTRAYEED